MSRPFSWDAHRQAWRGYGLTSLLRAAGFAPFRAELAGHHSDFWASIVVGASLECGTSVAFSPGDERSGFTIITHDAAALNVTPLYKGSRPESPITDARLKWVNRVFSAIFVFERKTGVKICGGTILVMIKDGIADFVKNGVSSSASLENATLLGLNTFYKTGLSLWQIGCMAKESENDPVWVNVGCGFLDQMTSAHGAEGVAVVTDCSRIANDPTAVWTIPNGFQGLTPLIINCGAKHALEDGFYDRAINDGFEALRIINERQAGQPSFQYLWQVPQEVLIRHAAALSRNQMRRARHAISTRAITMRAIEVIQQGDSTEYGRLMMAQYRNLGWHGVTCPEMDGLIIALQGKPEVASSCMMGGGFGGAALALVEDHAVDAVTEELRAGFFAGKTASIQKAQFGGTCQTWLAEAA